MNKELVRNTLQRWLLPLALMAAAPQVTYSSQTPASPPVPYASLSQLNALLSELEKTAQATQVDLAKLRIDKWKTDSSIKRQTEANVESLQRNLQTALPEITGQLRNSPENLLSTFKLYRNLGALYDVFASVVEAAGAFGSKDETQALENDLSGIERSRRSFAERVETLANAKELELVRLRTALANAQASTNAPPAKKVIVDDTEPPKKPARKKAPVPKPSPAPPSKPQ